MNITYLDTDTREVIKIADYPQSTINEGGAARKAKLFADLLKAKTIRLTPLPDNEWTPRLQIPWKFADRTPRFPATEFSSERGWGAILTK